jgi:hypothetical protein
MEGRVDALRHTIEFIIILSTQSSLCNDTLEKFENSYNWENSQNSE